MSKLRLEPEYQDAYLRWRNERTPAASGALLRSLAPILDSAQRSYGDPGSPVLKSRAKAMALAAMERYDPSQAKLRSYLMIQLQGLQRLRAASRQVYSVPERVALDHHHLRLAEDELRDQLGREPSAIELADRTNVPLKRIAYVRQYRQPMAEGQLPIDPDGRPAEPAATLAGQENKLPWTHDFVYHDLADTDRTVMEHSFGMYGRPVLKNQDIAKRLKVSPSAVSQRKANIQKKLDELTDLDLPGFS